MNTTLPVPPAEEVRFEDAPFVRTGATSYRNLIGVRFGRLIAVERRLRPNTKLYVWILLCDCGKYCHSSVENLRQGHKTSCGCARFNQPPHSPSIHRDEIIRLFTDPEKPKELSIGGIAAMVGVTKNAAIGVLNRAKLLGGSGVKKSGNPFPAPGTCYYMKGEFGHAGFSWCGKKCADGKSYCPDHYHLIYEKPSPQKRRIPSAMQRDR